MEKFESEIINNLIGTLAERIDLKDKSIWGHGTSVKEIARDILNQGIIVSRNYGLQEIAIPLTDHEKSDEENIENIINQSLNWKHRNSKFIVLISLPHGFKKENIIEEIIKDGQEKAHLPSRYILGYLDAVNMGYVKNGKFEKNPEKIIHEVEKKVPIRPTKGSVTEIPTAREYNNKNTPDVW